MGTQVRYGTIAVGAYCAHQPGSHQGAFTDQYKKGWDRGGARALNLRRDPMRYFSKWSFGCKIGFGDVSGADGAADGDMSMQDWYEPPTMFDGGQTLKFIKGLCVDTSDAPLSGVNVQSFRTSDNANASAGYTIQSREDGSYDVPTPYTGVNHYVVAYLAGSPDRTATTLNTLVPTGIDGT